MIGRGDADADSAIDALRRFDRHDSADGERPFSGGGTGAGGASGFGNSGAFGGAQQGLQMVGSCCLPCVRAPLRR